MSMQDPIADMCCRLFNAQKASHKTMSLPHSRVKQEIARVLKEQGYIQDYTKDVEVAGKPALKIWLKYHQGLPVIETIKRMSSPGRRRWVGYREYPCYKGGLGTIIVTTSEGFMSSKEAYHRKLGGELVCCVY